MTWVLVAIGGGFGAVLRDLATIRYGPVGGVDLANRVGAVVLGVVVAAAASDAVGTLPVAALGTGVAGGLTTFSTWVVHLVEPPHAPASGLDHRRLVRETVLGLVLAAAAIAATLAVLA